MFKLLLRRILIPWLFWADRSKKGAGLGWAGAGAGAGLWLGVVGWGWSGRLGCGLFGAWGWGYPEAEIGLFEDGKVVSKSKNELPDGQQQQAISIYFFLEGLWVPTSFHRKCFFWNHVLNLAPGLAAGQGLGWCGLRFMGIGGLRAWLGWAGWVG